MLLEENPPTLLNLTDAAGLPVKHSWIGSVQESEQGTQGRGDPFQKGPPCAGSFACRDHQDKAQATSARATTAAAEWISAEAPFSFCSCLSQGQS